MAQANVVTRVPRGNKYEVNGELTKGFIYHRDGRVTVFYLDTVDLPKVRYYSWRISGGYVVSHKPLGGGKYGCVRIHRLILDSPEDVMLVDHINHDTLDNRKSNLRLATHKENLANQRKPKNNTSGFKGVSFVKSKWRATITINNKLVIIGLFDSPEEANKARVKKAKEVHGDFFCEG